MCYWVSALANSSPLNHPNSAVCTKTCFICTLIFMQIKCIFKTKNLQNDLFWKRGQTQLVNGLLIFSRKLDAYCTCYMSKTLNKCLETDLLVEEPVLYIKLALATTSNFLSLITCHIFFTTSLLAICCGRKKISLWLAC